MREKQLRPVKPVYIYVWQFLFVLCGAGWLLAPILNPILSYRTSYISNYESAIQPFSWLFRSTDVMAALLLIAAVLYIHFQTNIRLGRWQSIALLAIGGLMLLDPIIPTDCLGVANHCSQAMTFSSAVHLGETLLLMSILFGLTLHHAIRATNLTTTLFVAAQISFFALIASGLADQLQIVTVLQFSYQFLSILWLAWYVRGLLPTTSPRPGRLSGILHKSCAIWAYLNGTLAIVGSLWHIPPNNPLIHGLYFGTDTAWLAQHGVVAGIAMLYVSRHLWHGEHRARQLFLVLLLTQVIKYSVITPQLALLTLYTLTFTVLFVCAPYFRRGTTPLPWLSRLQEILAVLMGTTVALVMIGLIITHNPRTGHIAHQAIRHGQQFITTRQQAITYYHHKTLVVHTFSALMVALCGVILWSLFRPTRTTLAHGNAAERDELLALLKRQARSSEDYFKYWPADKSYYWSADKSVCIAYRATKSVIFALADPVGGTSDDRLQLLRQFTADWTARSFVVCFLLVEAADTTWYESAGLNCTQVGAHAVVDINRYMTTTVRNKWWRWQRNRAGRAGYQFEIAVPPFSTDFVHALRAVSDAWLRRAGHREQGLLLGSFAPEYIQASRIHYLRNDQNEIIAFANQLPVYNNLSRTTIDMMRFRPEYDNAIPYLLSEFIAKLHAEGIYQQFDLGFVPLANIDSAPARIARIVAANRFSASGLEQFKNKFEPDWHKNYIAYTGDLGDLAIVALSLEDALRAS